MTDGKLSGPEHEVLRGLIFRDVTAVLSLIIERRVLGRDRRCLAVPVKARFWKCLSLGGVRTVVPQS